MNAKTTNLLAKLPNATVADLIAYAVKSPENACRLAGVLWNKRTVLSVSEKTIPILLGLIDSDIPQVATEQIVRAALLGDGNRFDCVRTIRPIAVHHPDLALVVAETSSAHSIPTGDWFSTFTTVALNSDSTYHEALALFYRELPDVPEFGNVTELWDWLVSFGQYREAPYQWAGWFVQNGDTQTTIKLLDGIRVAALRGYKLPDGRIVRAILRKARQAFLVSQVTDVCRDLVCSARLDYVVAVLPELHWLQRQDLQTIAALRLSGAERQFRLTALAWFAGKEL